MVAYLPAPRVVLLGLLQGRAPEVTWDENLTLPEMLVILADFDHNVDYSPYRLGGALPRPVETVGSEPVPMRYTYLDDFLVGMGNDEDWPESNAGLEFNLDETLFEGEQYRHVPCFAYDDDGILYFTLQVRVPLVDPKQDSVLAELLATLGNCYGVTRLEFPAHPELDCS